MRHYEDVPPARRWMFHLRLVWEVIKTLVRLLMVRRCYVLLRVVAAFLNDVVKTYHWDVLVTYHRDVVGCFIWDIPASLGWTERRCHDVITTSFCRVVVCNISIFFQFSCVYPSTWKKANIIPVHESWQSMSQQLCSFYQYLGKFLKNQFSIKCIIFLIGKNFSILTNLVIDI